MAGTTATTTAGAATETPAATIAQVADEATSTGAATEMPAATITQVADEVTSPGPTDRVAGTAASTRELDAQFKTPRKERRKLRRPPIRPRLRQKV